MGTLLAADWEPQLLRVWELGRAEQKEKLNSVASKASADPAGK